MVEATRPVAAFSFSRRKAWPFMALLAAMVAIGLVLLLAEGVEEHWTILILLILLPGAAFVMLAREVRMKGPILLIYEHGLLDRRRGSQPVPWTDIQEASVRRSFNKGLRVVLTNGERYDLELNLLAADPHEVLRLIQEQASRAAAAS